MVRHLILLDDGTEIFSGVQGENAIAKVTLTQRVNDGQELKLGAVCADVLEAELLTPAGALHIPIGTDLYLFKVNDKGGRDQIGLFTVEKAVRPSPNRYIITAYDRLSRLDKDLTDWLENLDGWPYSLQEFAQMVCDACDLYLIPKYFTNGEWPVQKFSAAKVTGRQLMQWVGEASCRFCRATVDGEITLDWYEDSAIDISAGEENYTFLDSLSGADYLTEFIDKVLIRTDTKDLGTSYGSGDNAYVITGNPLLATWCQESLQDVARVLYEKLFQLQFNPCKVAVPVEAGVKCGDILRLWDRNARELRVYVMKKTRCGQRDMIECAGSPRRDSQSAKNSYGIEDLQGKVLELEMGIDGIRAENRDSDGRLAALQLSVEGLKTKVFGQEFSAVAAVDRLSAMEQTAEGLSLQVKSVYDDGVSKVSTTAGYTFDETGITIKKSGTQIETQITENGIAVYKNDKSVLTADSQGVDAVDLKASTYLSVAGRCRFEKYDSSRVGCFWIGG